MLLPKGWLLVASSSLLLLITAVFISRRNKESMSDKHIFHRNLTYIVLSGRHGLRYQESPVILIFINLLSIINLHGNFRIHKINQDIRKLIRTSILIIIIKKSLYHS
ncbi:hypothetical protein NC651_008723 [Populus alba x Populus x berolinensis]|nr:hypothetical protein NC651_008723 [Populus alba x Populus x berolinensis]